MEKVSKHRPFNSTWLGPSGYQGQGLRSILGKCSEKVCIHTELTLFCDNQIVMWLTDLTV